MKCFNYLFTIFLFLVSTNVYSDINEDFRKAVGRGNLRQTQYLFERGADPKQGEPKLGITPIHIAVKTGNYSIVEYLLTKGVDPNVKDKEFGLTPVLLAAHSGSLEIIKLLILYKGDIHITDNQNGYDSLHIAAEKGNIDIVIFLLSNGANPNLRDKKGKLFIDKLPENQRDYFKIIMNKIQNKISEKCIHHHLELAEIGLGQFDYGAKTQGFLFEKLYHSTSDKEIFIECLNKYLEAFPDKYYWIVIFLYDEEFTNIANINLAKEILAKGLIANSNNSQTPSLLFLQGLMYWRENNKQEAKQYFKKAYQLSNKYPGSIPALSIQEKTEIDKFMGNKLD